MGGQSYLLAAILCNHRGQNLLHSFYTHGMPCGDVRDKFVDKPWQIDHVSLDICHLKYINSERKYSGLHSSNMSTPDIFEQNASSVIYSSLYLADQITK